MNDFNASNTWEWQGLNFPTAPLAFNEPLSVKLTVDPFEEYTDSQLDKLLAVMALTPQHQYRCYTQFAERMKDYFEGDRHAMIAYEMAMLSAGLLDEEGDAR